jgi:hypothetical protein
MYLIVDHNGRHNGQKIEEGVNLMTVHFHAVTEDRVHDVALRGPTAGIWRVEVNNDTVTASDFQSVCAWYRSTREQFEEVVEALRRQAPLEVERLLRGDCSPRVTRLIIENMPMLITHVRAEHVTEELQIAAALRDLRALPAVQSEALQLAVVAKRWSYIGNFTRPSLAVQLAAYRQDSRAVEHIREPHPELLALVRRDAIKKSVAERHAQIQHIELARTALVKKITEQRRQVLKYNQTIARYHAEIAELER